MSVSNQEESSNHDMDICTNEHERRPCYSPVQSKSSGKLMSGLQLCIDPAYSSRLLLESTSEESVPSNEDKAMVMTNDQQQSQQQSPPTPHAHLFSDPLSPGFRVSPLKLNFDNLSQLPTPVVGPGRFEDGSMHSLPTSSRSSGTKSYGGLGQHFVDSTRAISDYRPYLLSNKMRTRTFSNPFSETNDLKEDPSSENPNKVLCDELWRFYPPRIEQEFRFIREIGQGAFSTVVLCLSGTCDLATKIINVPTSSPDEISNFTSFIKRELNILYHIDHPSLVKLLDYETTLDIHAADVMSPFEAFAELEVPRQHHPPPKPGDVPGRLQYMYLNYCSGGSLLQHLMDHHSKSSSRLSFWQTMQRILSELIIAVVYLHSQNIVHRDIKLENVLLTRFLIHSQDTEPAINLGDFGLSKRLLSPNEILKTQCGLPDYISPEILMGLPYDGKLSDSWAIGVIIYAAIENRLPFDLPPVQVLENAGVSPLLIKRKLQKHSPAHRIATVDWAWFTSNDQLSDPACLQSVKDIIRRLQRVVEVLLIRKSQRILVTELLETPEFDWVFQSVPPEYMDF